MPSALSGGQQQRLGLTVAYVTHDQAEALAVSDQIVLMDLGVIAQAGTLHELYERPGTEFVAGFMGEAMLFDGVPLADGSVQLGPINIPRAQAMAPGKVKVAVQPEAWQVLPAGQGELAGTVEKGACLGSLREYTVATVLGPIFVVSPDVDRVWLQGAAVGLRLAGHGLSVVAM